MEFRVCDHSEKKRFEAQVEGQRIFIEYIRAKGSIYLTHTEVPKSLEGRGIGGRLVQQVLEKVKKEGLLLVPLCPFMAAYIRRHSEWKTLLAKGYQV